MVVIKNQTAFLSQVDSILKKKLKPVFDSASSSGYQKTQLSLPDATGVMKTRLSQQVKGSKPKGNLYSTGFGFFELDKGRREAIRRMEFGYQGLEPMSPELKSWLDSIGKPEWKTKSFILVGTNPLSSYNRGNPVLLGKTKSKIEIENKLGIKFL